MRVVLLGLAPANQISLPTQKSDQQRPDDPVCRAAVAIHVDQLKPIPLACTFSCGFSLVCACGLGRLCLLPNASGACQRPYFTRDDPICQRCAACVDFHVYQKWYRGSAPDKASIKSGPNPLLVGIKAISQSMPGFTQSISQDPPRCCHFTWRQYRGRLGPLEPPANALPLSRLKF